jgi:hypothetical protein
MSEQEMTEYRFVQEKDIEVRELYRITCLQCGNFVDTLADPEMTKTEFVTRATQAKFLIINGDPYCIECDPTID